MSLEEKKSTPLSRAEFLQTASKAALFAAVGISLQACTSESSPIAVEEEPIPDPEPDTNDQAITIDGNTITIDLSNNDVEALTQSEGWINITESNANVIVINASGTYRAFDNNCPHASCRTSWQFNNQRLTCTCHNSVFNNQGERVSGPATSDMSEFSVSRDGDILTISK